MRSVLAPVCLALALVACLVSAGTINNAKAATYILAANTRLQGHYYVRNVATGKYLQFTRENGKTNSYSKSQKATINLKWARLKGTSGQLSGWFQGVVLSGGNDKCLSAQYGSEQGTSGRLDVAAVSYACKNRGESVAKQVFAIVPCGSSSTAVSLARKFHRRSIDLNSDDASLIARSEDDFTSMLEKRGGSGRFCIITQDHLHDMKARAVSSGVVKSSGGYTSQDLAFFNPNDKHLWWDFQPT